MTPAFASIFRRTRQNWPSYWERFDNLPFHVLMLGIGLVIIACVSGGIQAYSLLAIPLIMLYSGKRGKKKMKAFFYIFYPAHLLVLECVYAVLWLKRGFLLGMLQKTILIDYFNND